MSEVKDQRFDGVCYEAGYEQAGTCIQGSVIVQVASTKRFFGAASIAPSDVCLWVKDDGVNATCYGSGTPCTGEAALAASATEFPDEASDAEA